MIFDVGGVLIRTEDRGPRSDVEGALGLGNRELEQLVFQSEVGTAAQLGAITDPELWAWLGERLGLSADAMEQVQTGFWGGDRANLVLLDLVRRLRPRYKLGIISNASDALHRVLGPVHGIAAAFDVIVGSAYERVMKPDPLLYTRALDRLGMRPSETVFVDDSLDNCRGAQAVGMHAIHYATDTDVELELARLGVRCGVPG
ncbi:MAG: uncharacterized protein H6Q90_4366 [Deltaproteobacteria bacterium]|nr:uncharacterized protein [Deltaproteobacteria bacterium]